MAFIQRYSSIDRGGIEFIGNTLGLSKSLNTLTAGTQGSIGAFTSLLDTQFANFPVGTTSNYLDNGSNAILNLPIGSSILYAELVWGGLYQSQTQNISNLIDNDITLTVGTNNYTISPNPTTAQNLLIPATTFNLGFYVRSAIVTDIVALNLNGTYSAKSIPSILTAISSQTNDTNHAGWTLCVVYKNDLLNLRNLTLWVGGDVVGPNNTVTDITLSGFLTPSVLPITGKAFLSAQEGDAVIPGDQFLFGKDIANLSVISGPNNPANNFFASQINNSDGLIETSGTFGTRNANALNSTNISAGRQGWDITAVDISNKLETSQNSALFRFTSSGDLYVPNALATQIDSLGASLTIEKSVDDISKFVGENINYTVVVTNTGQLTATSIKLNDIASEGTVLVNDTIFVDGVLQPNSFPINIDSILAGESKTVKFSMVAQNVPIINPVVDEIVADFEFEPFEGFTSFGKQTSNEVEVFILDNDINLIKRVDKSFAVEGDELLYSSFIANTGNLDAIDIVFTDNIPLGTSFVENSVFLDGVNLPGENPENGINIGNIDIGQLKEISFKVVVNTGASMIITNQSNINYLSVLPDGQTTPGEKESNIVSTEILDIGRLKITPKAFVKEGEETTQIVSFTNTSNFVLQNLFFTDTLSEGATYVPGTVFIDDVNFPSFDVTTGFALPDLPVGNNTKIAYTVVANNPKTRSIVDNFATLQFDVSDPISGTRTFSQDTNTVSFAVISTNITITKSVDKSYAVAGDTLTYTSVIENLGTQTATNIFFQDTLQSGITFIAGSVEIDGVNFPTYNPIVGFNVNDLSATQTATIKFKVLVE